MRQYNRLWHHNSVLIHTHSRNSLPVLGSKNREKMKEKKGNPQSKKMWINENTHMYPSVYSCENGAKQKHSSNWIVHRTQYALTNTHKQMWAEHTLCQFNSFVYSCSFAFRVYIYIWFTVDFLFNICSICGIVIRSVLKYTFTHFYYTNVVSSKGVANWYGAKRKSTEEILLLNFQFETLSKHFRLELEILHFIKCIAFVCA